MPTAQDFTQELLAELKTLDQRAQYLKMKGKRDTVILGIEDDREFVPILRLGAGSAKFNKMMLFVYHKRIWQPTFHKGTPKMLAQLLAGELNYLWTMHISMIGWHPGPPKTE